MKIIIAGGKGYLGSILEKYFEQDEIFILTRNPEKQNHIYWDGKNLAAWRNQLNNADVLINLSGKSVDCRYNEKNKKSILDSRIQSTAILNEAMQLCPNPPSLWINASSATIYRHSIDEPMDEDHGKTGNDFSMNVCQDWEKEFFATEITGVRKVAIRTAIVLGPTSAAFSKLKWLTRLGMGGKSSTGNQMVSWLHEYDFARAIHFLIQQKISGVVNLSAPYPIRNADFMKNLRIALHAPIAIAQPRWLLEIGAWLLGTETELILKSRYVVPHKLMRAGFNFKYRRVSAAFRAILKGKVTITPEGWEAKENEEQIFTSNVKQKNLNVEQNLYSDEK